MTADSTSATGATGEIVRRRWPRRLPTGIGYAMPAVALLTVFFVIPVLMLLLRSIMEPQFGVQNYAELFGSSSYRTIFFNTFLVAAVVTAVTVVIGFPLAWLLMILPRFWSNIVFGIVLLSMWTNLLTRTYAWMILLQDTGPINQALIGLGLIDTPLPLINNLTGVTIGMVYIMIPFMVMPLSATMSAIDPALLRAASVCGATRFQVFRDILLPLCVPGIAAGGLMIFVMSLGYFVTPALLGGASNIMVAELIAQLVQSMLNWGLGGAAAFVLLFMTLVIYSLQIRLVDPFDSATGRH